MDDRSIPLELRGKYQGVFQVKSRVKTWQVRGIWSQQLEHKHVPKRGTEPGVQKGKRSLPAGHTRCKCSMETTHNSVLCRRILQLFMLCIMRASEASQKKSKIRQKLPLNPISYPSDIHTGFQL